MKKSCILLVSLVAGCASTSGPTPTFINGHYYLAGNDPSCVTLDTHKYLNKIKCFDAGNRETGTRDAMTMEQVAMWKQMNQAPAQPVYQPAPMPVIQYPTMQTPQVTPLSRPGGNQMRCITAEIYTNCRY